MAISAKEKNRTRLLEYLGDPGNEWMTRSTLATEVLGYTNHQGLWRLFTGAELDTIEAEALEIRRQRCAPISAKIDQSLVKRAIEGDVPAMKLYYQRYEGWSEKQTREVTGKDGEPVRFIMNLHSDLDRANRIATLLDRAKTRRDEQSADEGDMGSSSGSADGGAE